MLYRVTDVSGEVLVELSVFGDVTLGPSVTVEQAAAQFCDDRLLMAWDPSMGRPTRLLNVYGAANALVLTITAEGAVEWVESRREPSYLTRRFWRLVADRSMEVYRGL